MRAARALACLGLVAACSSRTPPAPAPPVAKEDRAPKPTLVLAAAIASPDAGVEEAPEPPSLAGKTVLHVGDSMVGGQWGLTRALEAKFTRDGAKFVREYKVSESIASFDKAEKLKASIARHDPDIVIITLGTNDALVPYPQALASHVKNIVKNVGTRECYWMGPPLWKPDTGILAVLRDNAKPCKFYDSSTFKLQRGSDGVHPTEKGASDWADHFWKYFRSPSSAQ